MKCLSWNNHNDAEMCFIVRTSGIQLDDDDARMIRRIYDECNTWDQASSVYELMRLNNLVNQAIGWCKAKGTYAELCAKCND